MIHCHASVALSGGNQKDLLSVLKRCTVQSLYPAAELQLRFAFPGSNGGNLEALLSVLRDPSSSVRHLALSRDTSASSTHLSAEVNKQLLEILQCTKETSTSLLSFRLRGYPFRIGAGEMAALCGAQHTLELTNVTYERDALSAVSTAGRHLRHLTLRSMGSDCAQVNWRQAPSFGL